MRADRAARTLALAAFVALAGCAHGALEPGLAAAPPATPSPLRVLPHAPDWTPAQLAVLHEKLENALSASVLPASGIAIVDAQGRPLFERHDRRPMAPASTFKLVVATTALQALGPDYRFETRFESLDAPHDGTIDGDLALVGSGDPSLTSDDLRGGVGALVRAGVTHVAGDVVADASLFGAREINPAWDTDDLQYGFAAGTSALSLDEGTVEFHIVPGAVGAPARIQVRPPSDAVRIVGGVVTGDTTWLTIDRAPDRNDFTFDGHVAVDGEQSFWRPVYDQPVYAARVARAMLAQRGIAVDGDAHTGVGPLSGDVLWRHRSAPLHDLLRTMLVESDNHYAEQLLRAVGARDGALGTERSGAIGEEAMLKRLGAPANGLRIVDGSGLAPANRIAPISLATLLAREQLDPTGEQLYLALPRVGIEGTVRDHDVTTALGRARAKSGHIEDVNALAGYVDTKHHGRVAFSLIVNDPNADDGPVYDGMDAMLDILAGS